MITCYNKGVWLERYLCMLPPAGRLRTIREAVPMKLNCMDGTNCGTPPPNVLTKEVVFVGITLFMLPPDSISAERRVGCSSLSRAWAMPHGWNSLLFSGSVIFAGKTAGSSHISRHAEKRARCSSGFNQNSFFSFSLSGSKGPLSPKALYFSWKTPFVQLSKCEFTSTGTFQFS